MCEHSLDKGKVKLGCLVNEIYLEKIFHIYLSSNSSQLNRVTVNKVVFSNTCNFGVGNGTYQSTPTNVYASPSGTSLHFLRRSPRQTPTTEFPRSPASGT